MVKPKLGVGEKKACRYFAPHSFIPRIVFAFLPLIAFVLLSSLPVLAARNVNNLYGEVTINPSLNVTIPSNLVSLQLNPLNTDFGTADLNVSVSTNSPAGYTLTMSPTNANQTALIRLSGTETIPTLTTKSGGYTENEFTTNAWGYKLSNTNYLTFTNSNTINTTTEPASSSASTVTFAAKADTTQVVGTYQIAIDFTAVANPLPEPTGVPGKIRYNANSGTIIGQMGDQTAADGNTVVLYAPNFKNPGYGFAGWNTERDGSGTNLGPNESYLVPEGTTANGEVLYAKWIKSEGTLQNWTGCSSLASGAVTALTDNRDGNTYAIAKLADGKCWMIENLRLDDSAELSATNTNNPKLPLTNSYDLGTTSNHLSPSTNPTQTSWCTTNSAACDDQSMLATNNTTLFVNNTSSAQGSNIYSYGNYYNWYSATGGHGKYSTSTNNSSTPGDICPTGWHLPIGGNKNNKINSEFWNLSVAIIGAEPANMSSQTAPYYTGNTEGVNASKAIRTYPNNFIYSGYAIGSGFSGRGSYGGYWSSTAYHSGNAYNLTFENNYVYLGTRTNISKNDGRSVRCIAGSSEPYAAGYITYIPNANDVVGEMGLQSASNNQSKILYAPNYKRAGYGFAGWNTKADGAGTFYGPNQTYTTGDDFSTTGLLLYAIWVPSEGSMQDSSNVATVCNRLTQAPTDGTANLSSVSALTDSRDGDTYAIAKLADSKCWMTENLRLDSSAVLSTTNTNSPLLPLINANGTTSNSLSLAIDPTQTAWCTEDSSACDDQSMLATNNTTLFTSNTSSNQGSNIYSYGNYYNWYSVTGGNGKNSTGVNIIADGDLCPTGWHIPTSGNSSRDFGLLDQGLGGNGATSSGGTTPTGTTMSAAYRTFPNNFIYSGYASGSSISYRGSFGDYWSSTSSTNNAANRLRFRSGDVYPSSTGNKYIGIPARCIFGTN